VALPDDRLEAAGIAHGKLETWMLDPQLVASRVIRKFAPSPEHAERLLNNRIAKHVTQMVSGMQEYTAMEALHDFVAEGRYDLVVLDTPPSRNALDFLDGPRRLQRFFDGRIFQLFVRGDSVGFIRRAAGALIGRVMGAAFGDETYEELQDFFEMFGDLLGMLTANANVMRATLRRPDEVGFLLITSPAPEAVDDAFFFRDKTESMGLPFSGFVLNRSQAYGGGRGYPNTSLLPETPSPMMLGALKKLQGLAELEHAQLTRDTVVLDGLIKRAGDDAFAVALPNLPGGASDLDGLLSIADALMA
jgi:anion-transporting  ArsA/GET3 family ATPase